MRIFLLLILAISVSTTWAGDKDKDKQATNNEKKPLKVEQPYVKGKGKPINPGAHGRANAAGKQAANPGKGSKKDGDLEITPLTGKSNGKTEKDKNKKTEKGDKNW